MNDKIDVVGMGGVQVSAASALYVPLELQRAPNNRHTIRRNSMPNDLNLL